MLNLLRTRLRQGTRTSSYPDGAVGLPERYRGRPSFDAARCADGCEACRRLMPSDVLVTGPDGRTRVDVGASLFSPDEAAACPDGALHFTADHRMASSRRDGLVSADGTVQLAEQLGRRMRQMFGRSLRLRSVVAGSCSGCEAELVALGNVVFDLARFGVQFVASPRHADGIVLTGAVNLNMRAAVERVYDAMPEPRLVIAVGACAIDGGPFRDSPEVGNGAPPGLPVDLWIPGCPPHPLTILDGLLRLLGRLDGATDSSDAASERILRPER